MKPQRSFSNLLFEQAAPVLFGALPVDQAVKPWIAFKRRSGVIRILPHILAIFKSRLSARLLKRRSTGHQACVANVIVIAERVHNCRKILLPLVGCLSSNCTNNRDRQWMGSVGLRFDHNRGRSSVQVLGSREWPVEPIGARLFDRKL